MKPTETQKKIAERLVTAMSLPSNFQFKVGPNAWDRPALMFAGITEFEDPRHLPLGDEIFGLSPAECIALSIVKWEKVLDYYTKEAGAYEHLDDGGRFTCALCITHWRHDLSDAPCTTCPLAKFTGATHCLNTPYLSYMDNDDVQESELAAKEMLDLLYQVLYAEMQIDPHLLALID